jgi:plastocyanin
VLLRIPLVVTVLAAAAVAALLLPGAAVSRSAQNELQATVGPGFNISLTNAEGRVTHLDAGSYTIKVSDQSPEHNFHLTGPGVDQATDVDTTGTTTWNVTLTDGTFRYLCDAHPTQMKGSFTVGAVTSPPPPPPKKKANRLSGSVGPGRTIALRTVSGKRVKAVKAGSYRVTVRDASASDNFHLLGAGVNKRTGVEFKGGKTWAVRLKKGKTYRYRSDARPTRLKGAFRAT